MLDDWARIWVAVSCSVGVGLGVVERGPVERERSGTVIIVFGVTSPSARAAENVTSLKTDPGS